MVQERHKCHAWKRQKRRTEARRSHVLSSRKIGASAVHISRRGAAMMPHATRCIMYLMTSRLVAIGARRRRLFEFRIARGPMGDAEHALDAADHAADRRADDRADRPRDAVAFMKSMRRAPRNALRLRGHRSRQQCEQYASQYSFHHVSFFTLSDEAWPSMKAIPWQTRAHIKEPRGRCVGATVPYPAKPSARVEDARQPQNDLGKHDAQADPEPLQRHEVHRSEERRV